MHSATASQNGRRKHLFLRAPWCLAVLLLLAAATSASEHRPGFDAAISLDRAIELTVRGQRSLARSHLEPVLLTPRLSRAARARAYYLRGLTFYGDHAYVSASQDYRRALEFMPTLAAARSALAWLHLQGLGVAPDPARAVRLYRLAARQGHQPSQFNLALLLAKGQVVAPDVHEALAWFTRAAATDHPEAAALAGQLLARGRPDAGLAPDPAAARALLTRAAEADHPGAEFELGLLLLNSEPATAAHWLERAAEDGMANAQRRLGYLLQRGGPDLAPDPERGLLWLREAAKHGDAPAQTWLGWAYDTGAGVSEDPKLALRWYTRAARRDDATAQLNLALLYRQGRGTAQRDDQAQYWFEQAAAQGEISALSGLAWLLATTRNDDIRDGTRALEVARRAVAEEVSTETLEALAAALAETGEFEQAVTTQQRALTLLMTAPTSDATATARLQQKLDNYRAGRPWRSR